MFEGVCVKGCMGSVGMRGCGCMVAWCVRSHVHAYLRVCAFAQYDVCDWVCDWVSGCVRVYGCVSA